MNRKEFLNLFNKMSKEKRREVCCEIKRNGNLEPVSWGVAWIEIKYKTKISELLLKEINKRQKKHKKRN